MPPMIMKLAYDLKRASEVLGTFEVEQVKRMKEKWQTLEKRKGEVSRTADETVEMIEEATVVARDLADATEKIRKVLMAS